MVRVTVSLDDDMHTRLQELRAREGRSIQWVIARALDEFLGGADQLAPLSVARDARAQSSAETSPKVRRSAHESAEVVAEAVARKPLERPDVKPRFK